MRFPTRLLAHASALAALITAVAGSALAQRQPVAPMYPGATEVSANQQHAYKFGLRTGVVMLLTKDSLAQVQAFYAGKGLKFQRGRLDQNEGSSIDTTAMRAVVHGSIDHSDAVGIELYVDRFSTDEVNMLAGPLYSHPELAARIAELQRRYAYLPTAWFPRKPDASGELSTDYAKSSNDPCIKSTNTAMLKVRDQKASAKGFVEGYAKCLDGLAAIGYRTMIVIDTH